MIKINNKRVIKVVRSKRGFTLLQLFFIVVSLVALTVAFNPIGMVIKSNHGKATLIYTNETNTIQDEILSEEKRKKFMYQMTIRSQNPLYDLTVTAPYISAYDTVDTLLLETDSELGFKKIQTGGELILGETKMIADHPTADYSDAQGFTGTLQGYVFSGSFTPGSGTVNHTEKNDTGTFPSTVDVNGVTLNKDGNIRKIQTGGDLQTADIKFVSGQDKADYKDDNGFEGTLSEYVESGSVESGASKVVTRTEESPTNSFPEEIPYDEDGYKGTLTKVNAVKTTVVSGQYTRELKKDITLYDKADYNEDGYTGTLLKYQSGGDAPVSKEVTNTLVNSKDDFPNEIPFDSSGFKGILVKDGPPVKEDILVSGSLIPEETKFVTAQTNANYNQDGFKGTLTQYVYGGTVIPAETKDVVKDITKDVESFPPTYYFDEGGFKGTLSKIGNTLPTVKSGSVYEQMLTGGIWYALPKSYTYQASYVSMNYYGKHYGQDYYDYIIDITDTATGIKHVGGYSLLFPSTHDIIYLHNNAKLRTESLSDRVQVTLYLDKDDRVWEYTARYAGKVTKPEENTVVYRYQGNVTKPEEDTRVYRTEYTQKYKGMVSTEDTRVYHYKGEVTKPESDTRVYSYSQGYSGNVSQEGTDTRVMKYQGVVIRPEKDTRTYEYEQDYTGSSEAVDTRVFKYKGIVSRGNSDTRTYTYTQDYINPTSSNPTAVVKTLSNDTGLFPNTINEGGVELVKPRSGGRKLKFNANSNVTYEESLSLPIKIKDSYGLFDHDNKGIVEASGRYMTPQGTISTGGKPTTLIGTSHGGSKGFAPLIDKSIPNIEKSILLDMLDGIETKIGKDFEKNGEITVLKNNGMEVTIENMLTMVFGGGNESFADYDFSSRWITLTPIDSNSTSEILDIKSKYLDESNYRLYWVSKIVDEETAMQIAKNELSSDIDPINYNESSYTILELYNSMIGNINEDTLVIVPKNEKGIIYSEKSDFELIKLIAKD